MMQDQTDKSQINHIQNQPVLTLSAKAVANHISIPNTSIYYGLTSFQYCQLDFNAGKPVYQSPIIHQSKISSIKNKQGIIITASHDSTLRLFDIRSHQPIHSFKKIPGKFNCVDKTEHILAAGCGSNIIFWDLRKMKQRSQFKDSFEQQVTDIKFDTKITTNLYGCSLDGMINLFDLTEPNEQDAFSWCYKIFESPQYMCASGNRSLVKTTDHILLKIEQGELVGKITPNHVQKPKHIMQCEMMDDNVYRYSAWNIEQKVVQIWEGQLMDKTNQQKCIGYVNNVSDIQLMNIVNNTAIYTDQTGKVYFQRISEDKYREQVKNQPKMQQQQMTMNRNGYMLKRSSILKSGNPKKFRPY